jgi:26S proteasome regulatory subunit N1
MTKSKGEKSAENGEKKGKKEEEVLKEPELSEEDQKIKEEFDLLVERCGDSNEELVKAAIIAMKKEIRTSTSSMTSVPKPLKFLHPHFDNLKAKYEALNSPVNALLADVLSWLGMTSATGRESLNFRLKGTGESVGSWGHEYARHLCLELGDEWAERQEKGASTDDIQPLCLELVEFLVTHNAEPDACDLLIEIEQLDKIVNLVSEFNFKKICLYLESCSYYLPEPEDTNTLRVALRIYQKMGLIADTMRLALALMDGDIIKETFQAADPIMKKQLAFLLGSHNYFNFLNEEEEMQDDATSLLLELMGNVKRTEYFKSLATSLDLLEPKLPEDIYKAHLADKEAPIKADSARQNLAHSFVNAFVNAGFGSDKLLTGEGADGDWLFKNKEHCRISAAASVGMIYMWDNANGVNELEKYSGLKEDVVKAGVMLGIGITNANVRDTFNVPYGYAVDNMTPESSPLVKQVTAFALGLSYAGTPNTPDVTELLRQSYDEAPSIEVEAQIALALGLIHSGTCNSDLTELFVNSIMERDMKKELGSPYARYLCLALGFLFLGKQEEAEVTLEALKIIPGVMGKYASLTVETCAYCGTGNVLKVQKLLAECGEHLEEKDNLHQAVAVLGIALVALREYIGKEMIVRSFDHLLQYGEVNIKRAVPLALGMLSISKPEITIMDTLSKFSHDHDAETAMGAIFALGLIGAGTNNSRIAQMLRGLASYYHKEPNTLFIVRIAQGILHLGKGTISMNPYHSEGTLIRPTAIAGLLITLHTCFDFKNLILGQAHYMLYSLVLAMFPRMLMTFNENMEPLNVLVRVGQAVDVVGKAGNPKNITGFQTHTTPVLLGVGDRAELATDEYIAISPVLEGCIILKHNPQSKLRMSRKK